MLKVRKWLVFLTTPFVWPAQGNLLQFLDEISPAKTGGWLCYRLLFSENCM